MSDAPTLDRAADQLHHSMEKEALFGFGKKKVVETATESASRQADDLMRQVRKIRQSPSKVRKPPTGDEVAAEAWKKSGRTERVKRTKPTPEQQLALLKAKRATGVPMIKQTSVIVPENASVEAFEKAAYETVSSSGSNEYLVEMAFYDEMDKIAAGAFGRAVGTAAHGIGSAVGGVKGIPGAVKKDVKGWGYQLKNRARQSFQSGLQGKSQQEIIAAERAARKAAERKAKQDAIARTQKQIRKGQRAGASRQQINQGQNAQARAARQGQPTGTPIQGPPAQRPQPQAGGGRKGRRRRKGGRQQQQQGQPQITPVGAPANAGAVNPTQNAGFFNRNFGWGQQGAVPVGPLQQGQSQMGNWYRGLSRDQVRNNMALAMGGTAAMGMAGTGMALANRGPTITHQY
tara:strand:- start:1149 stop:2357 length:1209 start_codon:yes stop_codon:yes gene_type:complete